MKFVAVPNPVYQRHYYVFCNPLLWFVQHFMWNTPRTPNIGRAVYEAWESGYIPVNQAIADSIIEQAQGPSPVVLLQDYHLYLAPAMVRAALPEASILHFTHIPWPAPEKWAALGRRTWVKEICRSLLASDIVGFQTERDAANFVATAKEHLPGIKVRRDPRGDYLVSRRVKGKVFTSRVRHYPISIDPARVRTAYRKALADGYPRQAEIAAYRKQVDNLVVRIDRLDPSKSTLEGFQAYRELLARRPDLHGKVGMMAILVPSRENVAEYAGYKRKVLTLVDEINREYGSKVEGWEPIRLINENNYPRALALMGEADVLLVNSKEDGMNLVSKEFAVINSLRPPAGSRQRKTPGVLLLSPTTGAWAELGEGAIPAGPDPHQTAAALETAIAMKPGERRRRAAILSRVVRENPIAEWTTAQLEDFLALDPGR